MARTKKKSAPHNRTNVLNRYVQLRDILKFCVEKIQTKIEHEHYEILVISYFISFFVAVAGGGAVHFGASTK